MENGLEFTNETVTPRKTKKKKRHKSFKTEKVEGVTQNGDKCGSDEDVFGTPPAVTSSAGVMTAADSADLNDDDNQPGRSVDKSLDCSSSASKEDSDGSLEDYKSKVENAKLRLRSSKSVLDDESKKSEQNVVRTGFWEKLRYTMSQPVGDEQAVAECRRMFREEMIRLRREVEEFRELCLKQIKTQKLCVEEHRRACEKEINSLSQRNGISRRLSVVNEEVNLKEELKEIENNVEYFQNKQKLLDQEMELLNKEEELSKRQKELEDYEKEIQEVESLLNQRQAICDRRQKHLLVLDEELHSLRQELEESKEQMQQEVAATGGETPSEKARKNWDIVRRNLMDKQHLLETTVQKYRSELASASSNIAGKEILIGKLQQQLTETEAMLIAGEKRIKQLETKLAFSVTESRVLEDQLHGVNRKNSLNISPDEMGRKGSFFHRQTSSEPSGSRSGQRSPLLKVNDLAQDDAHKFQNGSLTSRPSSLSSPTTVIRRRSMRSNSVAGDTISRLRDAETDQSGSGACALM